MMLTNKQINNIMKVLENIIIFYEKYNYCLDDFNFKVHNFFYELWNNEELINKLNIKDDNYYNYLNHMFDMYLEEEKEANLIQYEHIGRTSTCFLNDNKKYTFSKNDNNTLLIDTSYSFFIEFLYNTYEKENYNYINIIECLKECLKDLENKNYKRLYKNYYNQFNFTYKEIIEELNSLKTELIPYIKTYHIIKIRKESITLNNFLQDYLYYFDIEKFIEENKNLKYITYDILENIYQNTNYKVISSNKGKYIKIYISYAKKPLILKIVDTNKFINYINSELV